MAASGGTGAVPSSAKRCTTCCRPAQLQRIRQLGDDVLAASPPTRRGHARSRSRCPRDRPPRPSEAREHVQAFRGERGIGLDAARLDRVGRVGGLIAHEIDLSAHQIGHRRAGALVRDGRELRIESLHDEHAAKLRGGADAGVGIEDLIGILLHVADQSGEILRRKIGPRDERHRHLGDKSDGSERAPRVIGQVRYNVALVAIPM